MTTKLVLRLLTAEGQLLGWTDVQARARGDGCLRAEAPVRLVCDVTGLPAYLSIHWADLHTETRVSWTGPAAQAGLVLDLFPAESVLVTVGQVPGPLPPVTIRGPVAVAVPVGQMGARG